MFCKFRNKLIANMVLTCNPHYLSACCTWPVISNISKQQCLYLQSHGIYNFPPTTPRSVSRANKPCHETRVIHTTAICNLHLLKPTGYVMHQQVWHSTIVRSAHTVFMCFVFIWEKTATCATYTINWLVL